MTAKSVHPLSISTQYLHLCSSPNRDRSVLLPNSFRGGNVPHIASHLQVAPQHCTHNRRTCCYTCVRLLHSGKAIYAICDACVFACGICSSPIK